MHQHVDIQNPYMDGWYASMRELDDTREQTLADNPHPTDTEDHYQWALGYTHGVEEDADNEGVTPR